MCFLVILKPKRDTGIFGPLNKRHYISADVTFFESQPYFSPTQATPTNIFVPTRLSIPVSISPSPPAQPLQVHTRLHQSHTTHAIARVTIQDIALAIVSCPLPESSSPPAFESLPTPNDLPIALCKGKHTCTTKYPISNHVSLARLSLPFCVFTLNLLSTDIPTSYCEAIIHPHWRADMDEEMHALRSRGTWVLVSASSAKIVACQWVFTIKFFADGTIDRYKARLVDKGTSKLMRWTISRHSRPLLI